MTPLPPLPAATEALSLWLMLKVFSSGCTAMTGVEAVSNGVMAFRDDTRKNAKITLTIIIVLLAMLLLGIALLCRAYGVGATDPGGAHYESVLSMLTRAVMGQGWFYYIDDRVGAAGAGALGKHRVCRFSAPDARDRGQQLSAPRFSAARAAAALLLGNLCTGRADGDCC